MKKKDLLEAASKVGISDQQAEALANLLGLSDLAKVEPPAPKPISIRFEDVAYYLGGMLVIAGMAFFITDAWSKAGGKALASIGAIYILFFTALGYYVFFKKNLRTPGGILLTIAVWMVPILVYGIQDMLGLWYWETDYYYSEGEYSNYHNFVQAKWIIMELCTIAVGTIFLLKVPFPFISFPIAYAAWYLSMDLTPYLFGDQMYSWEARKWVSVVFGLLLLALAYAIDYRTKLDYSFWFYLFGLAAFWGGLSSMNGGSELGKFIYCMINVLLLVTSFVLQRASFAVFGGIGIFMYIGYLSNRVFQDSMSFSIVITFIGVAIIGFGIYLYKNRTSIEKALMPFMPPKIKEQFVNKPKH